MAPAHADAVEHLLDRRPGELELRVRPAVVDRDREVVEDRVEAAEPQILVRVDQPVVGPDDDPTPSRLQDALRERVLERPDAPAFEVGERVDPLPSSARTMSWRVVAPLVGDRKIDLPLAVLGDLQTVEREVVVAALEAGDEAVRLVLDEDGAAVEPAAERLGQLDLEADRLARVLRVLEKT